MSNAETVTLKLADVRLDGGTQSRLDLSQERIADYAENVAALPPVLVYFDGADRWLVDGFHRWHAHKVAGRDVIAARVVQGSLREAVWVSFGANKEHDSTGLPRERGDRTRTLEKILADAEWKTKTGAEIAAHVGVSQSFVSLMKKQLRSTSKLGGEPPVIGADGKNYPARYKPRQPKQSDVTPDDVAKAREALAALKPRGGQTEGESASGRRVDPAIAERTERIGRLLSDGLTEAEICRELGVEHHHIQRAKDKLGLRPKPGVLRRLLAHVHEFNDALNDHVASDEHGETWKRASAAEVAEVVSALESLRGTARIVINRLKKEAKGETSNGQTHQAAN